MNNRGFKGIWIPAEIWNDNNLTALDKIIYAEIDSLDSDDEGCYAGNTYLAGFCQCSEGKVSQSISKLIDLGYLYVRKFDGRQRWLKSNLKYTKQSAVEDQPEQQLQPKAEQKKSVEMPSSTVVEIIDYLNEKCGAKYKAQTPLTRKLIAARLKEGFSVQDFKTVIDKKCSQWLHNEKMSGYLRPNTLFGTKFEGYLNETVVSSEGTAKDPNDIRKTPRNYPTLSLSQNEVDIIFTDPKYFDTTGHVLGEQLLAAVDAKNRQLIADGFSAYNNGVGLECIDRFLEKNPKPLWQDPNKSNIRL